MKRWGKNLLIVGLAAIALVGCSSGGSGNDSSASGNTINWTDASEITTGNSLQSSDSASFHLLGNIEEGLYVSMGNGQTEEGVVDGKPEISEDGKTYTYKIKDEAKWSNGDPVTAKDFVFAWQRLADPKVAAPYAYLMEGIFKDADKVIAGEISPDQLPVKAIDDKTLEVTYENAVPYLEDILAMAPFLPVNQKFYEEQGDKYGTNDSTILYNGPFTLQNWNGTSLTWDLVKNKDYWDADKVKTDKVHFQVTKENSTALNLFDSGEIDYATLSGDYILQRQDDPNLKKLPEATNAYLKLNRERNGKETPLANKNIRKAITQAIDVSSYLKDVTKDGSEVLPEFVPNQLATDPNTGKDFNESVGEGLPSYDPKTANENFQKGLKEIGQDSITLEFLTDDTEAAKRGAQFFQEQLQKNLKGLKINIVSVPFKNRIAADKKQDFEIQLALWGADYADPINYLELFLSNSNNNGTGYADKEYDSLIGQARQEKDEKKRSKLLTQAQRKLLIDDVVVAPLYQRTTNYLENPSVKNVKIFSVGSGLNFKYAEKTN